MGRAWLTRVTTRCTSHEHKHEHEVEIEEAMD